MKNIVLPSIIASFFVFSVPSQAYSDHRCNDAETKEARELFLTHFHEKDYTAAYYAAYLYAYRCPSLFSAANPSNETLWLLSDYSLAAARLNNQQACDDIASLVDASALQKNPRVTQAIQTNLSLCSIKQVESELAMSFTRANCALDKDFIALPESWLGKVANYENVQCIGPKTLTPTTSLTLLQVSEDNETTQAILEDVIVKDNKTRQLFLSKELPMMVANLFNNNGNLQSKIVAERIEYHPLRSYQSNKVQQQQIAQLNEGMTQIKADNDVKEYMEELEASVAEGFTVDPYNWWAHKPLLKTQYWYDKVIVQYDDSIKLIYVAENEIHQLDLLTAEQKLLLTTPKSVYVYSVEGAFVYFSDRYVSEDDVENVNFFKLDLSASAPALISVTDTSMLSSRHSGEYSLSSAVSHDQQSKVAYSEDRKFVIEHHQRPRTVLLDSMASWSINDISWGADDTDIYFDNSSAYACIWRADLLTRTLDRVVPISAATSPLSFRVGDVPYVIYADSKEDIVYLATPMK